MSDTNTNSISSMSGLFDLQATKNIFNKREPRLTKAHVGKNIVFRIQGGGNVIDVENKAGEKVMEAGNRDVVLQKQLWNLQVNSEVAVLSARNKQTLQDAVAAERAGEAKEAHKLFNDYLNRTQVSFGVLSTSSLFLKLRKGHEIAANVQLIATENGEVLTIDPSTISILEPERIAASSTSSDPFATVLED